MNVCQNGPTHKKQNGQYNNQNYNKVQTSDEFNKIFDKKIDFTKISSNNQFKLIKPSLSNIPEEKDEAEISKLSTNVVNLSNNCIGKPLKSNRKTVNEAIGNEVINCHLEKTKSIEKNRKMNYPHYNYNFSSGKKVQNSDCFPKDDLDGENSQSKNNFTSNNCYEVIKKLTFDSH